METSQVGISSALSLLYLVIGVCVGIVSSKIEKIKLEQNRKKIKYVLLSIASVISAIYLFIIPLYGKTGNGYSYDVASQLGGFIWVVGVAVITNYLLTRSTKKKDTKQ